MFCSHKDGELRAYKIMPIDGDQLVNDEHQKTAEEIIPEAVISLALSMLSQSPSDNQTSTFIKVHNISVCRGRYPGKEQLKLEFSHFKLKQQNIPSCIFATQLRCSPSGTSGQNRTTARIRDPIFSMTISCLSSLRSATAERTWKNTRSTRSTR